MNRLLRAAWVIARRDFTAVIFSKAFFFFLLGPVLPLAIGVAAGGIGHQMVQGVDRHRVAIMMSEGEAAALLKARDGIATQLGEASLPSMQIVSPVDASQPPEILLARRKDGEGDYTAVLSGSLSAPLLTAGPEEAARWKGPVALAIRHAREGNGAPPVNLEVHAVQQNMVVADGSERLMTAQLGQILLFLLTMLLAGMVLSNLVEEKTNKIIEILAAAVPIDAIFIGKLFAMLGMAFIGIFVWAAIGMGAASLAGQDLPNLPAPALGWPVFLLLGVLYFSMAYLLLGALFLGIGAMATTVREVQALSMPVTMAQLLIFFLASYSVARVGEPMEVFAAIFPFSSPFAMLARAAQQHILWHHVLALLWQGVWVWFVLHAGARLFRRNVLKSGGAHRFFRRR